jgi:starch synthase
VKILYATAEVHPFAKVGGLADVAAALPARLKEIGHDVRVVAPCHASSRGAFAASKHRRRLSLEGQGGDIEVEVATVTGSGGVPVDLVLDARYFGREAVYGEPDDLLRYQAFCRAIIAMLQDSAWTPDILHLNDWHTAPLAFGLRNVAWGRPILRGIASVLTIHNLRYRGPDDLNDYLSQAIYYSDVVTTVSPTYAKEILTEEFGEGLETLLELRKDSLRGIVNGLDYETFNPRTDLELRHHFDLASLEERVQNRAALRTELKLPETPGPIAATVARLTEQKGIDLVLQSLPEFLATGAQLVVLGEGDAAIQAEVKAAQAAHPESIHLAARFDEPLAHRIYAGADMFLMPSRYEPCGLGQLMAMRYGAVPIGRRTGGIADTVLDFDEHPETGTGFLFDEFSAFAFAGAFERAVRAFRNRESWARLQQNGMSRDFSWRASATHYVEAYRAALRARGIAPRD